MSNLYKTHSLSIGRFKSKYEALYEIQQIELANYASLEELEEASKKLEKLDSVVDQLKQKYGYNSITRAGKLHSEDVIKLKDV